MKKNFKKIFSVGLGATLMLTSCGQAQESAVATNDNVEEVEKVEKLKIIATTFPEYDWLRQILGDNLENVELIQLMDSGVDLHSFSPTAHDIVNISDSDMFVHVGGVSTEAWMDDVLSQSVNPDMVVINLMEELGGLAKMSEHVEGMQEDSHDHDHDHEEEEHDDHDHEEEEHDDHDHEEEEHDDHDHEEEEHDDHDHEEEHDDHDHEEEEHDDHDHEEEEHDDHDHEEEHDDHDHEEEEHDDHDHEEEEHDDHDHEEEEHDDHDHEEEEHDDHAHEDEHIWLSLRNAEALCVALGDYLIELDPDNAISYEENLEAYIEQLNDLDKRYEEMVAEADKNTFVVADRFPFLYLADDYGLDYYAAFSGCSAETEASFETVVFLAEKINEFELSSVVTTETGNTIAQTVADSTNDANKEVLVLDSMQSLTSSTSETYLSIMENNLEALREILK